MSKRSLPSRSAHPTKRLYQDKAVGRIDAYRKKHPRGRMLVVMPTGAGKTMVVAMFLARALRANPKLRGLILCHRIEITLAFRRDFLAVGIDPAKVGLLVPPDKSPDPAWLNWGAQIQIASIQKLQRMKAAAWPKADILVSDEAHLDEAKGRRRVKLEGYARAFHLGVTATPCRLDGIGLKDSYDHLDHVVYPSELLHDGYLAPCRIMAPPENFEPDLKGIRLVRGDYNTKELSKGMVRLVGAVVPQWRRYAKRKPTLVFAVDRNHSKVIAKEFNDAGIRAVHLDGDASAEERREIVAAFKRGDIKVLCSCDLFAAGTDMPWVKVVMLCRPTKSLTLFMQQCGRGVRPHKGHVLTLLDHAGNSEEHGDPFADRDYDLEGRAWFVKPELGPLKCCDGCRRYIRRSLHECPHCGHVPAPRPIEVVEGVNLVQRAANRNDIETEVRAKVASWLDFVVTDEWIDKVVNAKMGKAA